MQNIIIGSHNLHSSGCKHTHEYWTIPYAATLHNILYSINCVLSIVHIARPKKATPLPALANLAKARATYMCNRLATKVFFFIGKSPAMGRVSMITIILFM